MLSETTILILGGYTLAALGLLMFFRLKHEKGLKARLNGKIIQLSKAEGKLRKSIGITTSSSKAMPDIQDMSIEQAAEMFGIDAKELNNPLVRPIADKIFNRLRQGEAGNVEQEQGGY